MTTLAKLETQPTRANTTFQDWWELVCAECERRGIGSPTYGPARDFYEMGFCPRTAAAEIEATQ